MHTIVNFSKEVLKGNLKRASVMSKEGVDIEDDNMLADLFKKALLLENNDIITFLFTMEYPQLKVFLNVAIEHRNSFIIECLIDRGAVNLDDNDEMERLIATEYSEMFKYFFNKYNE